MGPLLCDECKVCVCVCVELGPVSLSLLHHPFRRSTPQATSVGSKETEATNMLEKKFKGAPQMTYEEAVLVGVMTRVWTRCGLSSRSASVRNTHCLRVGHTSHFLAHSLARP